MIYFAQDPKMKGGWIKIGATTDLVTRIKYLRARKRLELQVLGVMPGYYAEEARLHELFGHLRVRYEWFRPAAELLAYIGENAQQWGGWKDYAGGEELDEDAELKSRVRARRRAFAERNERCDSGAYGMVKELGNGMVVAQSGPLHRPASLEDDWILRREAWGSPEPRDDPRDDPEDENPAAG